MNSEYKHGVILSYVSIGLHMIVGLLFTPFLIRTLGTAEYGLYQLIGSFVGYLTIFDFGLSATIIRYTAKYNAMDDREGLQNFLGMHLIIYIFLSILTALVGMFIYFKIDIILGNSLTVQELSSARNMFLLLVISFSVSILGNIFTGVITGNHKFVFVRMVSIIKTFMKVLIIVVLTKVSLPGAMAITLVDAVVTVLVVVINATYAFGKLKVKFSIRYWDMELFKETAMFSFFNLLQVIMGQMYWKVDQLILGMVTTTTTVAIYSVAMQINDLFLQFTSSITSVLLPKATEMEVGNSSGEKFTDFMIFTGRIILIIYSCMTIGLYTYGKNFISLWAGIDFVEAWTVAMIIILASAIPRIQAPANDILKAKKKHGMLTSMYAGMAVANVVLSIILIKHFGIVGAAIGTAIPLILGNTVYANFYYSKYAEINITRYFKELLNKLWAVIIIGFIFSKVINIIHIYGWLGFFIKGSMFTIVYILLTWIIGLTKNEKNMAKKLFKINRG
ncbi:MULTISPECIES: oligosaccharide flippase family protein [unclassified Clostridium]|uniref:oligosaccharide flippase family protein n=1 Tax=unclassified Clostridium TaxID=2614128 RepID=UPI003217F8C1